MAIRDGHPSSRDASRFLRSSGEAWAIYSGQGASQTGRTHQIVCISLTWPPIICDALRRAQWVTPAMLEEIRLEQKATTHPPGTSRENLDSC